MNHLLPTIDRRQFALASLAAAAASAFPKDLFAASDSKRRYKYCAFTKLLGAYDYEQLATCIAEAGFDGIEVAARKHAGYIRPDRAVDELPALSEALAKHGLEITILTTDVLRADQPHAEQMLRTAKQLGIKRYRLGFYKYNLNQPVIAQLQGLQPVIRDIVDMNRAIGIASLFQNHSGAQMVGATLWDLHSLIKEYPTSEIGCAFDIRHATVEGGKAWPVYYNIMKPHLGALSMKDFEWKDGKIQDVPFGNGQVDHQFFQMVRNSDFAGPITVHVEYLKGADAAANLAALKTDLDTLRGWLEA